MTAMRQARRISNAHGHLVDGVAGTVISYLWLSAPRSKSARTLRPRKGSEAGFTLVEVIVALAMLSAGLSLVLGLISGGLNRTGSAGRMAEAGSLAQSLLAQVGTEWPIKPDERDGRYPNGYRWNLKIYPYGGGTAQDEMPVGLYRVSAEVEWDEGANKRSYALATLRLGPRAPRP